MRQQPPRECRRNNVDPNVYRDSTFKEQYKPEAGPSNFTRPGWPSNGSNYADSVGSFAAAPSRSPSPAPSSLSFISTTSSEEAVLAQLFPPKYPKDPISPMPSWNGDVTGHFNRVNPRSAHLLIPRGLPPGYEDLPRPTGSETSTEIIDDGSMYGSSRSTVHRMSVLSEQDVNNQIEEDRRRHLNGRLFANVRPAGSSSMEYAMHFGPLMAQQQKSWTLWKKAGLQVERITTFFEVLWCEFSVKKICSPWVFSRAEFLLLIVIGVMIAQFLASYFK